MAMTDQELVGLVKGVVNTTGVAGLVSAEDAQAFFDLSVEQTGVLQHVNVITGITRERNVDSLLLGEPVIVSAVEGTAPAGEDVVAPTRVRKVLRPRGVLAAFDVTFDFLRQNIEGDRVNESLNRIFAKRFGKDVVLAAFNGDTALAPTSRTNKALRTLDGLRKQMGASPAAHGVAYDLGAGPVTAMQRLGMALGALPKDYRDDREALRFFVSADTYDGYADEVGSRATAAGDSVLLGSWNAGLRYKGVKVVPVFGVPNDLAVCTLGENVHVGFGRDLSFGVDVDNRARLLKVTITADVDVCFAVDDAVGYSAEA